MQARKHESKEVAIVEIVRASTKVTHTEKTLHFFLTKDQSNAIAYKIKEYQQQIHAQVIAGIEVENRWQEKAQ